MKSQPKKQENKEITKNDKTINKAKEVERAWYEVDAKGKVLGRLSTKIAKVLMGKDKTDFVRYKDMGDNVVVINAAKIAVTGRKEQNKKYFRYSGYPSGLKEITLEKQREKKPEEIIIHAVSGMLPKNRLGKSMIKKLHVYPKDTHPHEAQNPVELEIK
jgi:large subunit ribosomal protein L13